MGKATIPFLGSWVEEEITNHELTFCMDDSVNANLIPNVLSAFSYWGSKLYKMDEEYAIGFQPKTFCNNVDIVVRYEDTDNEDGYNAITYTSDNAENILYNVEMVLYPNDVYKKDGYDYEPSGEYGDIVNYDDEPKDGPRDNEYYKWSLNNIKHEVGHVLGLDHITDNPNYLMYAEGRFEVNYPIS